MPRKMSKVTAGRKGGEKTKRLYGKEHYEKIGKKGGKVISNLVEKYYKPSQILKKIDK